jgi:hypothetical protein
MASEFIDFSPIYLYNIGLLVNVYFEVSSRQYKKAIEPLAARHNLMHEINTNNADIKFTKSRHVK